MAMKHFLAGVDGSEEAAQRRTERRPLAARKLGVVHAMTDRPACVVQAAGMPSAKDRSSSPAPAGSDAPGRAKDKVCIARLLAREEAAFRELVTSHHGALVRVALLFVRDRAAAEEVVQETWARVLASLQAFEGRSSLRTWIFRICANTAKTRASRDARTTPLSALEDPNEPAVDPGRFTTSGAWGDPPRAWEAETPESILERREAVACIERTLEELPPAQRAVLTLRDVQGLDAGEVCNILELSESNQRVLLHRARSRVRRALERLYAENE
jgi:RNA polymerase sigma-70 factor, ECF subfamily